MYEIKHPIDRVNYGQKGMIVISDNLGTLLELHSRWGVSYIYRSQFNKLIKEKKIIRL